MDKRFIERMAYRLSHQVIVNCDDVRRQLVDEGVAARKVSIIYNGLDPDLLRQQLIVTDGIARAVQIADR